MFTRFRGIYGHRWASVFRGGEAQQREQVAIAAAEWGRALTPYDEAAIEAALAKVAQAFPEFAPTLGQFLGLLDVRAVGAHREFAPRLEHKRTPADRDQARQRLAEIRRILGQ